MPEIFQWLSRIAANFESYKFHKLKFCYEPEAPSTLGGTLLLSVDYDAADAAPSNKQTAMAARGAVRSAPWGSCSHVSLPADLNKMKSNYVRGTNPATDTDIRVYDIGNLHVVTQGVGSSSAACGELYVEYDVTLMTPIYEPNATSLLEGGAVNSGEDTSPENPLGVGPLYVAGYIGPSISNESEIASIVPGDYIYVFETVGTGITGHGLAAYGAGDVTLRLQATLLAHETGALAAHAVSVWYVSAKQEIVNDDRLYFSAVATTLTGTSFFLSSVPVGSLAAYLLLGQESKPAQKLRSTPFSIGSERKLALDEDGDVIMVEPVVPSRIVPSRQASSSRGRKPIPRSNSRHRGGCRKPLC